MGSSLCPANKKDIIQSFTQKDKEQKWHQSSSKNCLAPEQEDKPLLRDPHHSNKLSRPQSSAPQSLKLEESVLRYGHQMEELREEHPLPAQPQHIPHQIVTVTDVLLEDGWKYSGTLKGHLPEGKGEEFGPNGDHFIGRFQNGQKNGDGTYYFSNGAVYKGEFKDNLMDGYGEFEFPNGDVFKGWFKNNVREGKGKYVPRQPNIDGMLYFEGEYRNDLKNGAGVIKYQEGEVRGMWKDGIYDYCFLN